MNTALTDTSPGQLLMLRNIAAVAPMPHHRPDRLHGHFQPGTKRNGGSGYVRCKSILNGHYYTISVENEKNVSFFRDRP